MEFDLKFLPSAELDIADAMDFYSTISEKVFRKFNQKLDQTLMRIQMNPYFQKRYRNVRSLPIKSFPYLVFF